jgi:thymidylate synthase (FAD)
MKIVEQSFKILSPVFDDGTSDDVIAMGFKNEAKLIERAGRTTYKSESKIAGDSYYGFISNCIECGNESVLEFGSMTVKFITDRGVSHELARRRTGSFAQESTRYCNYDNSRFGRELTVIKPSTWDDWSDSQREWWKSSLEYAELNYLEMVQDDMSPMQARSVLPNSLKTEAVIRANFREWRHIFALCAISKDAHPDMRALMIPLYNECCHYLPCVFERGKPG